MQQSRFSQLYASQYPYPVPHGMEGPSPSVYEPFPPSMYDEEEGRKSIMVSGGKSSQWQELCLALGKQFAADTLQLSGPKPMPSSTSEAFSCLRMLDTVTHFVASGAAARHAGAAAPEGGFSPAVRRMGHALLSVLEECRAGIVGGMHEVAALEHRDRCDSNSTSPGDGALSPSSEGNTSDASIPPSRLSLAASAADSKEGRAMEQGSPASPSDASPKCCKVCGRSVRGNTRTALGNFKRHVSVRCYATLRRRGRGDTTLFAACVSTACSGEVAMPLGARQGQQGQCNTCHMTYLLCTACSNRLVPAAYWEAHVEAHTTPSRSGASSQKPESGLYGMRLLSRRQVQGISTTVPAPKELAPPTAASNPRAAPPAKPLPPGKRQKVIGESSPRASSGMSSLLSAVDKLYGK